MPSVIKIFDRLQWHILPVNNSYCFLVSFNLKLDISDPYYTKLSPSMKPTLKWGGGLSDWEVSTSPLTRTIRRSNAATFDQNKQIFLSTLPRTRFSTQVCSYVRLSWLGFDHFRESTMMVTWLNDSRQNTQR